MENQLQEQIIVTEKAFLDPSFTSRKAALFNPDGTPYAPSSGPVLLYAAHHGAANYASVE